MIYQPAGGSRRRPTSTCRHTATALVMKYAVTPGLGDLRQLSPTTYRGPCHQLDHLDGTKLHVACHPLKACYYILKGLVHSQHANRKMHGQQQHASDITSIYLDILDSASTPPPLSRHYMLRGSSIAFSRHHSNNAQGLRFKHSITLGDNQFSIIVLGWLLGCTLGDVYKIL